MIELLIQIGTGLAGYGLGRLSARAAAGDEHTKAAAAAHLARMRAIVRARLLEADVYGDEGQGTL